MNSNIKIQNRFKKSIKIINTVLNKYGMCLLAIGEYFVFNKLRRYYIIAEDVEHNKKLFQACIYSGECMLNQVFSYNAEELMLTLMYIDMVRLTKPNNQVLVLPRMFVYSYGRKLNIDIQIPEHLKQFRSL